MKNIFIIQKGWCFRDRTAFLVSALKEHENVVDIKDVMEDSVYKNLFKTLQRKKLPTFLKEKLVRSLFGKILRDYPECQTLITTISVPAFAKIIEKFFDFKASFVYINDIKLKGYDDLIGSRLDAQEIENYVLVYGKNYKKIAESLLL